MNSILLIEDDKGIITALVEYLSAEGFVIDNATGKSSALAKLSQKPYDLIILDITLSDGNGFSVCAAIKNEYDIPIIFLSADNDESSIVAGLDLGADDYITKPFRPRELLSRIKSVLRRECGARNIVSVSNVTVDIDKGSVMKNQQEIFLTALEYKLLLIFIQNRGKLLSRERLLNEIWDIAGDFVNDNTLTVYIKRLREKIEDDPALPQIIKTVRGLGYRVD